MELFFSGIRVFDFSSSSKKIPKTSNYHIIKMLNEIGQLNALNTHASIKFT